MFVSTVTGILVPRFELLTAVGKREELMRQAVAIAPEPDREQVVGEVSGAAEAVGVHAGMRLGEALARCPDLRLVAADPDGAASAWEAVLGALEGIGAAIESSRSGEACFEAGGLRRLYGGSLEGVLARARRAVAMPARLGAAGSRFCAFAAAGRARPGRAKVVPAGLERAFLAPLPVSLLRSRAEVVDRGSRAADLCTVLERLGVRTLGDLAALPADEVADRFGRSGLRARELALGLDAPLRPRPFSEGLSERLDLPEAVSGPQLERSLELLIDRLLARSERRGRSFRRLRLGARFVEQGTWRREVAMREATASRERLRLALAPRLAELPAPVDELSLAVVSFGPPAASQLGFRAPDETERRKRLAEALRQTRAAAGPESLLRVLELDPGSRIPERRALLTPFPE
jgi:nucleotidyltransferase/DNA polymerase involved in DNA repair